MSKAKAEALANMDPTWPIEKLPDCPLKWDKILEKGKNEPDWKYTDDTWNIVTDSEKVIGKKLNDLKVSENFDRFERASDMPGWELFIEGASCRDIT